MSADNAGAVVAGAMAVTIHLDGTAYRLDLASPLDISIPLDFHGHQPNAFHLPQAVAHAAEGGGFIGDTRRGGSCNCETVTLNPHGNGTHTECVGHITDGRLSVSRLLRDAFVPCVLVTVTPGPPDASEEISNMDDLAITRSVLDEGLGTLGDIPAGFFRGLVLRTLPNNIDKKGAWYSGENPPYVTPAAMYRVRELGVEHLLLDLPSADREDDGGRLGAHRIFWDVPDGIRDAASPGSSRTITEMIYVPDDIADGLYVLNLQIPPFMLDAAPSRPILFKVGISR